MTHPPLSRIPLPPPFDAPLLVTGGTGTFGHALVRVALERDLFPRLLVFSRDEYKQAMMAETFGHDPRLRFYLGDVRDLSALRLAFRAAHYVIHAAALKQVDRSARDFPQFVQTNVVGTMNVVHACHDAGVRKCVVLSTDKACEATTPYGATKAVAEWLAVTGSTYGPCRFAAVRYGNVIGSRGSVLEVWRKQVEAHGEVRLTDPNMTRFWMTPEDAVALALYALANSRGGEVFVPKDPPHSSIRDLARSAFPRAPHRIVGKRAYEKKHEVLVSPEELDRARDVGPCVVLVPPPAFVHWDPPPFGADAPPLNAPLRSGGAAQQ
ncbi:MAG TPA: NAD-dependent epimerase/dehydratase family protein [Planctomycetaceae bacterium]|nr:NAD-dependent epimerase/dehydratase family protein [Planctomycetaceae bacterium]